jgi:hypothetical protein
VAHREWTEGEIQRLREMVAEGQPDKLIAQALGRTRDAVADARKRRGIPGGRQVRDGCVSPDEVRGVTLTRVVSETPERVVIAPEESDEEPIGELLERTIKQTSRAVQKAKAHRHVAARLITRRPIGIAFASDQHLATSGAVDVAKAFEDAEAIQQEPGLFCILGGDGVDQAIKHLSAMVSKASAPSDEWRLYDHYLATLGHKVLAVISGNHDDFSKDVTGVCQVARLAARHKIHFAPDEVTLRVELAAGLEEDGQAYICKVRHQFRYGSTLNVGNTVKRLYDMGGDPFDVGCVCHNHEAHVESFERHGRTRWALRPGSYQIQTGYGRRYGYNPAEPTCPVAVLWPDEHRVVCFRDLREGIMHLRAARAEYDADPPASLRAVA